MDKQKRKIVSQTPPPAFRVFVSSTYTDMLPYREAIQTALNKADCIPYGMERFGAEAIPPLEVCYRELEASQIYVCALGMRYGSIDEETGKSYTQLEYEKARELGKPTLVFLIDENKVRFNLSEIDMGEAGEKLAAFKKNVKDSKEVTCAFFDSAMSLQETVYRSIDIEIKRQGITSVLTPAMIDEYILGAKAYRNFVRRPERYKDTLMTLRVRMDGKYGGWMLKDELFEVFDMPKGDALYLNDLWVLGINNIDVDSAIWQIDCFASGDAADWLDSSEITQGTIFEGRFLTKYKKVSKIAGRGKNNDPVDAMIAKLILIEGIRVIDRDVPVRASTEGALDLLVNQILTGEPMIKDEILDE